MRINRAWAMPNKDTFSIKPIRVLVDKVVGQPGITADPFSNGKRYADLTNDLDESLEADSHEDALDFLRGLPESHCSGLLFDPPYSPRQVAESYKKLGRTVDFKTTQSSYWSRLRREIGRVVVPGGLVLTCSWNSGGIGKFAGFEIEEILIVCHGGWHNDTICVLDRRL